MNRRSITIVVAVILCAVGFAYGEGWLHWSRTGAETDNKKAGTRQPSDQQKAKNDTLPLTPESTEPAAAPEK